MSVHTTHNPEPMIHFRLGRPLQDEPHDPDEIAVGLFLITFDAEDHSPLMILPVTGPQFMPTSEIPAEVKRDTLGLRVHGDEPELDEVVNSEGIPPELLATISPDGLLN